MTILIPNSIKVSMPNSDGVIIEMITGADVFQPLKETTPALEVFFKQYRDMGTPDNFKVADFGSGTGQLGILVKRTYPQTEVSLYENDVDAEKYIRANAELHAVDVSVNMMDVADITATAEFDAVISSPPFLPEILKKINWSGNHNSDPETAIFGGYRGLDVTKVFIAKAAEVLKPGGYIVQTHSHPQTEDVVALLGDAGFSNIETFRLNDPSELDLEEASFTLAFKN
jgi:methylase of polypeptide subunit release factors